MEWTGVGSLCCRPENRFARHLHYHEYRLPVLEPVPVSQAEGVEALVGIDQVGVGHMVEEQGQLMMFGQ